MPITMNESADKRLTPLVFTPYLKRVIWGGHRICRVKGLPEEDKVGESWEISALPGHVSVVSAGAHKGRSLDELVKIYGARLLGSEVYERYGSRFPLLIKFIDACHNLSVQVHPTEQMAMERHGSHGKDEMWYIIDADKDAKIYAGLSRELTPHTYREAVADGSIAGLLNSHTAQPGDVLFLQAGLVHAIGSGNFLAEVQVSSDVTYRIFDYNRLDDNGLPRTLHTELAKDAIDYRLQPVFSSHGEASAPSEALVDSRHFTVTRIHVDGRLRPEHDSRSFTVLMCVEGECTLRYDTGSMPLTVGHTVLIPAETTSLVIEGNATLLSCRTT